MNQATLFPEDDPPDRPVAVATPPPSERKPARYQSDPELEEIVKHRTDEQIAANMPTLQALRRAAAGYFHTRSAGKTYKRDPALKVTIPDPGGADDTPRAKLVIHPGLSRHYDRQSRQVCVEAERIKLSLFHIICHGNKDKWQERIELLLKPEGTVTIGRRYLQTSDVDAARLCATASRFLDDPLEAIAASGTHCVFCGRALTVTESRVRGIGPECFAFWGDFLKFLDHAPNSTDPRPAPPSPAAGHHQPDTKDPSMTIEPSQDDEYSTDPGEHRLEFPIGSRVRFDTMFDQPDNGRTGTVLAFRMNYYGRDKYKVRWDDGREEDEIPSKCLSQI